MRLKGRKALVTGGSLGLGADIAIELAKEGAAIVVNYNSSKQDAEAVQKTILDIGQDAWIFQANVGNKSDCEKLAKYAINKMGRIDILINNAGIALWRPFFEIEEDNWDKTIDVNLKSVFILSQLAARSMKDNGGGTIVNISSIAAHGSMDCLVPYNASKGGMTLITKAMATELAKYNIRVNALAPGTIDIKRNRETDPNYPDNWLPHIPMGRVGVPCDISKPVVFLASDESSYITGQLIFADGGLTNYVPMPSSDFVKKEEK